MLEFSQAIEVTLKSYNALVLLKLPFRNFVRNFGDFRKKNQKADKRWFSWNFHKISWNRSNLKDFLHFSTSLRERKERKSLRFDRFHFSKLRNLSQSEVFPFWILRKVRKTIEAFRFLRALDFRFSNLRNRTRRRLRRRIDTPNKIKFVRFGTRRYGEAWWSCQAPKFALTNLTVNQSGKSHMRNRELRFSHLKIAFAWSF